MSRQFLIDTGPLVALLDRRDSFHRWAYTCLKKLPYPLLTCEPVITEACFLLADTRGAQTLILEMMGRGDLRIAFSLNDYANEISALMTQYRSVPMSLADACLVKMAELSAESTVVTIDSDFNIYRKYKN